MDRSGIQQLLKWKNFTQEQITRKIDRGVLENQVVTPLNLGKGLF